ncbi:hypothetical protein HMPREF9628_00477 [Peptoanaerobacter stomatis]|uniref:MOSC domain-containing protein n=1 Tax=Peptoanaerobacter stomatis TaxID=796937 RepID=G9XED3_9FIRM|nr:MOSC domain-containing protein [Peptoanaerobacter stomatis]EHL18791.1 hypothetical protein HMPREF9628_00477 [Peptoanaerobacter stomatis]
MISAKVLSVNISEKKGDVKIPIDKGEFIKGLGLKDDSHAGDWHRQVSLLSKESIDFMREKSNIDVNFGDFAENITTQGITLHRLPVGTVLKIGECILKVTQIGKECHHGCNIMQKVGSCIMPTQGIFATIEKGGLIQVNDDIEIISIPEESVFTYSIIIVSDKGSQGLRQDGCKEKIVNVLGKEIVYKLVNYVIVPDEMDKIEEVIRKNVSEKVNLILTSGGTGFSKRDVTPEATKKVIERETPGISEYIRARSLEKTDRAILSRAISGIADESLIINLPGSPIAVQESLEFIADPLKHGLEILLKRDAECAR